ncbi:MAG: DNA polymerase I [Labilithrix sp.]|nr:DNA polymerase I [Labilithrix sp.]MCW5816079.1 DNA polymerase I [Labilithrix sp.]
MPPLPASLPPPGSEDVLYLVDLSGYVYRAYHAIAPLSSSKGETTHAVLGTVNMLQKVVNERLPAMFAVAMDSKQPSFRKEIDVRYKATRQAMPSDLAPQITRVEELVRAYNIPIFRQDGIEADDLIATIVQKAHAQGLRTVIVGADKDLMQVVHDGDNDVMLWDSMRDRTYGPVEVEAKFGVKPSMLRDLLALTGDTSDNIPGVPSVGPKTAADLLKEFGTIENLYANLDKVKRPKLRENLTNAEADARISQTLVTLRADLDVEVSRDELRYGGADLDALKKLFLDLEFTRLLDQISQAQQFAREGRQTTVGSKGAGRVVAMVSRSVGEAPAPAIERKYRHVTSAEEVRALLAQAKETKVLGLGVAMTVPDPMRAELLGVSLAAAPGEGVYVPFGHRYLGAPKQLGWEETKALLAPVLADPAVRKVAYDLKRIEDVFARSGLVFEGAISDPMLAAYLLDPESPHGLKDLARREFGTELPIFEENATGRKADRIAFDQLDVERATTYAAPQAELAVALAERLDPRIEKDNLGKLYTEVELPLTHVLAAMEQKGVLVDVSRLAGIAQKVESECQILDLKAQEAAGRKFAIRSRDQLEAILFDELKLPVVKRTMKGGRSTDAAVLEELSDKHPLPGLILEFRELDKLKGTYLEGLPRAVNPSTGRIHTRFEQAVAATGRLSSTEPNLQNIPIRKEVGRLVRSAFVAPPGFRIVSADYSQIELRVLAHLAKDPALGQAFQDRVDVHTHTASLVFDTPRAEVTAEQRRRAKAINFGLIYGMGEPRLARDLGITRQEAASFIATYFERFAGVRAFMDQTIETARQGEAVRTILGRRRFLPNLHSSNRGLRFEAERVAKNTPIQGAAADILKLAMIELGLGDVVPGARMILTVHDELVFEVPEAGVEEAKVKIKAAMEGAMTLDVPLEVDVGDGAHWGEAH